MAHLTGMGLTSANSALISGTALSCMDKLSAVSPANHLAQMSWVYCGATLDSTLITPLPPRASSGTIWSSLPE